LGWVVVVDLFFLEESKHTKWNVQVGSRWLFKR
jgi:hypothetical protein